MKSLLLYILSQYHRLCNAFVLRFSNSSYGEELKVHGVLVRRGPGRLKLGKGCTINSSPTKNPVGIGQKTMFYISKGAEVEIGNNVGITTTLFYSRSKIHVEDNVLIGGGCQIMDTDFHSLDYEDRVHKGDNNAKTMPITIKEGAFIGARSIVLKGVTIGARSIVAAGSVVSRPIPDNEIWGGNPAKFIKKANS